MNPITTAWIISFIFLSLILMPTVFTQTTHAKSSEEKAIGSALKKIGYKNVCKLGVTTKSNNQTQIIYNNAKCNPVTPPVPPNPTPASCIIGKVPDGFMRVGVTADTKTGGKEFQLMKDCGSQVNLVAGDLWYTSSCSVWLSAVQKLGWTKDNSDLVRGNHDDDPNCISNFNGLSQTYGVKTFGPLAVFNIDANIKFDCSSPQATTLKTVMEQNKSPYKIAMVHQPFVTGKTTHSNNGQFNCYQSIFKTNNIQAVLQGHNHDNQLFNIDGIIYTVGGVGTHDTGSGLYKITSPSDGQGHTALFTNDKDNAVLFLDLSTTGHNIKGNFVSLTNKVLYTFNN